MSIAASEESMQQQSPNRLILRLECLKSFDVLWTQGDCHLDIQLIQSARLNWKDCATLMMSLLHKSCELAQGA